MKLSSTLLILGASIFIFGIMVILLNWFTSGNVGPFEVTTTTVWAAIVGFVLMVGVSILRKHLDRRSILVGEKLSFIIKGTLVIGVWLIISSSFLNRMYAELWELPNFTAEMHVLLGELSTITPLILGIGIGSVVFGGTVFVKKTLGQNENSTLQ
ncbi:MAG: hypothetical protein ACREA8_06670 [Nitrosotalea sp.]